MGLVETLGLEKVKKAFFMNHINRFEDFWLNQFINNPLSWNNVTISNLYLCKKSKQLWNISSWQEKTLVE